MLHVDTFTIVAKLQALHAGSQAFGDGTDGATAVDRDICRGYKSVIYMYDMHDKCGWYPSIQRPTYPAQVVNDHYPTAYWIKLSNINVLGHGW